MQFKFKQDSIVLIFRLAGLHVTCKWFSINCSLVFDDIDMSHVEYFTKQLSPCVFFETEDSIKRRKQRTGEYIQHSLLDLPSTNKPVNFKVSRKPKVKSKSVLFVPTVFLSEFNARRYTNYLMNRHICLCSDCVFERMDFEKVSRCTTPEPTNDQQMMGRFLSDTYVWAEKREFKPQPENFEVKVDCNIEEENKVRENAKNV